MQATESSMNPTMFAARTASSRPPPRLLCGPVLARAERPRRLPPDPRACSGIGRGTIVAGDVVAAVDRYQDIAPDVRAGQVAHGQARLDDVGSIRPTASPARHACANGSAIANALRQQQALRSVSRTAWSTQMRSAASCTRQRHCILCRRVPQRQRIARAEVANERADGTTRSRLQRRSRARSPARADSFRRRADGARGRGSGEGPPRVLASSERHRRPRGQLRFGSARGSPTAPSRLPPARTRARSRCRDARKPAGRWPIAPVPEPETWG